MATLCGAWGERESWQEMCPPIFLALYPGLFSSALVACSTANARGVKRPGYKTSIHPSLNVLQKIGFHVCTIVCIS